MRMMNEGHTVDMNKLEFAMALDSVSHRLLLANMKSFELGAVVVPWIESYIAGWVSSVHVNDKLWVTSPMGSDVPHCSVICQLLFLFVKFWRKIIAIQLLLK